MWFYLLAAALALHTYFWGAGFAWFALPRPWRRWWWVSAPGCGLALQSAVVWAGAHTDLPGTDSYAAWSELLPAALLGAAWQRARKVRRGLGRGRGAIGCTAVMALTAWLLLSPMAAASRGPTTLSLGSCDAADYAAGARVFREFSRNDRTGFLGQPEVTRVRSVEYFFDFFLRLNHFTPSALLAHNGSILDEPPQALAGVTGAVLAVLNLPAGLFLARIALGLRGFLLLAVTAVLAFSPLQAYAVYEVALGQLYAVQGILLLTISVFGSVRTKQPWACAPLALAGFMILGGAYIMLLPVCLVPAGAWLLVRTGWRRDWRGAARTVLMLSAMATVCAGILWARFACLPERFSLLHEFNFGWPVPLLTPEGWLGLVRGPDLHAWSPAVQLVLLGLVAAGWLGGMAALWGRHRSRAFAVLAFVVPLAAGWSILAWEARQRANASYDAYKLVASFQPILELGLLGGLAAAAGASPWRRILAGLAAMLVLVGNLVGLADLRRAAAHATLRVDRPLLDLAGLESDPRVASVNVRIEEFWARLWANTFLLRKAQYFPTHSYEGRRNTALKGQWDLSDSPVCSVPFAATDVINVNRRFRLLRADAAGRIEASFGPGWHELESAGFDRWRWTSGEAELELVNPADQPLRVRVEVRAQARSPRDLQLLADGVPIGVRPLGVANRRLDFGEWVLPPGRTRLTLHASLPAGSPGAGDRRRLSVALHELTLTALPAR